MSIRLSVLEIRGQRTEFSVFGGGGDKTGADRITFARNCLDSSSKFFLIRIETPLAPPLEMEIVCFADAHRISAKRSITIELNSILLSLKENWEEFRKQKPTA